MFWGTIAHYEVRSNVEFINVFRADKMPQIHDVRLFCFDRKLNRADSKNSVMTLTRIKQKCILIVRLFGFQKT
jgi:hypothetical protein